MTYSSLIALDSSHVKEHVELMDFWWLIGRLACVAVSYCCAAVLQEVARSVNFV